MPTEPTLAELDAAVDAAFVASRAHRCSVCTTVCSCSGKRRLLHKIDAAMRAVEKFKAQHSLCRRCRAPMDPAEHRLHGGYCYDCDPMEDHDA